MPPLFVQALHTRDAQRAPLAPLVVFGRLHLIMRVKMFYKPDDVPSRLVSGRAWAEAPRTVCAPDSNVSASGQGAGRCGRNLEHWAHVGGIFILQPHACAQRFTLQKKVIS